MPVKNLRYQVEIPQHIVDDPVRGLVDSFTVIYDKLGPKGMEDALLSVMDVLYKDRDEED